MFFEVNIDLLFISLGIINQYTELLPVTIAGFLFSQVEVMLS